MYEKRKILQLRGKGSSRRCSGSPLIHVGLAHAHRKGLSPRRKRSNDFTLTSHHPIISQRDTKWDIVASTLAHRRKKSGHMAIHMVQNGTFLG